MRHKRFGVLQHRGAAQFMKGFLSKPSREFSIRVSVERNAGASRKHQFCAAAWISKRGHARRKFGFRQGAKCASTPTRATAKALQALAGSLRR